ncbi:MAG: glycerophosphodiester phosphodiesterase family protein [Candidatus Hydrogenedens sp.]|nr:glycerophosphodiester phosphodiesterase family protein [Candidatus Hydrogenedens sp.]
MSTLSFSPDEVFYQAHRGGMLEVPENTLAAYRYAWSLGAIPEVDICSSLDREIICIHDNTLARTTNATKNQDVPVSELTFKEIRQWDAGSWFSEEYTGEKIPSLEEVLKEMMALENAQIYLDLKNVDLKQLAFIIKRYNAAERIIFCHNKEENCRTMAEAVPGLRTMLWIGGKVDQIQDKFNAMAAQDFAGLDQVQLHLHRDKEIADAVQYLMPTEFLEKALEITGAHKIDLEVLPFEFDCESLGALLDLGIRWYATDEPRRFTDCVKAKAKED